MTALQRATVKRMEWEDTWKFAGRPTRGAVFASYRAACERELDLVVKGIDARAEAARIRSWVEGENLCPDVISGCDHIMVMNEDGVGVACK